MLEFEPRCAEMWDGIPLFVAKRQTAIALFPLEASSGSNSGRHGRAPSMLHFALRAGRDNFTAAQEELKRRGIEFQFEDHEISHSIYFHDPNGDKIEITTYEL